MVLPAVSGGPFHHGLDARPLQLGSTGRTVAPVQDLVAGDEHSVEGDRQVGHLGQLVLDGLAVALPGVEQGRPVERVGQRVLAGHGRGEDGAGGSD